MKFGFLRDLAALIVVFILAGTASIATASVVTFDISGQITAPPTGNLSGTLDIDVTNGSVTGANVIVPTFSPFNVVLAQSSCPTTCGGVELTLEGPPPAFPFLLLVIGLPPPATLVGFTGGELTIVELVDSGEVLVPITEFDLTPEATPLPATLPLFATGLGALGLLARRRKRKQAA